MTTDPLAAPAATASKAILGAMVRHAITAVAIVLASRGYIEKDAADAAIPPLADYAAASIMLGVSVGWSGFRAWVSHTRWYAA